MWPELVESPVVLTNMQRIYAPVISESAIALMLALARNIPRYSLQTQRHEWQNLEGLQEISGMTLGLVGSGRNRDGDGSPRPLRLRHEGVGSGPQANSQAGFRGGASLHRLAAGDGLARGYSDVRRAPHARYRRHAE